MPWQDRVREAAYTPPSGFRFTFKYEDVQRITPKRTALFEFPTVDGGFVQDNGFGARRYPLRCFFSGPSHDLEATQFELALCERGPGRLEHPFYGTFDAIPFGDITRDDRLKTEANQTVIEVTFYHTLLELYPSGLASARNEILAGLDAFDLELEQEFADQLNVSTASARAVTTSRTRDLTRLVADALGAVSGAVTAVDSAFRDAQAALNYGLDLLVGQPLQLARQVLNLTRAPSLALIGLQLRLAGYRDFAERVFAGTPLESLTTGTLDSIRLRLTNGFRVSDLFAQQAVAGAVSSVYASTFDNRAAAMSAADGVLSLFDDLIVWRDGALRQLGVSDPGASQQALRRATARAAAHLIETSVTLAPERRLVLDRPRTIIDLCAELYGSVDDRLDYLITTNNLVGSEILELPAGASIAYYR